MEYDSSASSGNMLEACEMEASWIVLMVLNMNSKLFFMLLVIASIKNQITMFVKIVILF